LPDLLIDSRCVEENRELMELVQEKDRRIQYLELRIQQLTLVNTSNKVSKCYTFSLHLLRLNFLK
jgi:hypothetical protein